MGELKKILGSGGNGDMEARDEQALIENERQQAKHRRQEVEDQELTERMARAINISRALLNDKFGYGPGIPLPQDKLVIDLAAAIFAKIK